MYDEVVDADGVCRLCLNSDGVMVQIHEENTVPQTGYTLIDKILLLAAIQISPEDGFPSLICLTCRDKVEEFVKFKEQIESSHQILNQCLRVVIPANGAITENLHSYCAQMEDITHTVSSSEIATKDSNDIQGQPGKVLKNKKTNQNTSHISSLFKDHLVSGISENDILVNQDFTFVNASNTNYINVTDDTDNYISIPLADDAMSSVVTNNVNILNHKDINIVQQMENNDDSVYVKTNDNVKYSISFTESNDENLQDIFLGLEDDEEESCHNGFEDISKYLKNSHGLDIKKLKEDFKNRESSIDIDQDIIKKKLLNNGVSFIKSPVAVFEGTKVIKQIMDKQQTLKKNIDTVEVVKDGESDANNFPDMIFAKMSAVEKDKYTMIDNQHEIVPRIVRLTCLDNDNIETSQFKFATYLCHLCLLEFRECSMNVLKNHANSHFSGKSIVAKCQNEPMFACEDCAERFTSRHAFINHQRKKLNIKIFTCDTCSKSFWFKDRLTAHIRVHNKNPNPFPCIFCGETFDKKHELQSHELSHTRDTPLICRYCDKVCVSVVSLKTHLKRHTEGTKYCCELCGKGFYSMTELKRHEQSHTGVRKFPCQFCTKAFCSNAERRRHLQYHFKNKRFQCNLCDKKFYEAGHLKIHLNVHKNHRPFVCDICPTAFHSRYRLKRHLTNHHKRINPKLELSEGMLLKKTSLKKGVNVVKPKFTKLCNVQLNNSGEDSVTNLISSGSEDEEDSYIILQEDGNSAEDVDGDLMTVDAIQAYSFDEGQIFYIVDDNKET